MEFPGSLQWGRCNHQLYYRPPSSGRTFHPWSRLHLQGAPQGSAERPWAPSPPGEAAHRLHPQAPRPPPGGRVPHMAEGSARSMHPKGLRGGTSLELIVSPGQSRKTAPRKQTPPLPEVLDARQGGSLRTHVLPDPD